MSTTTAPTPQTEPRDNTGLGGYTAPEDGHARELVSMPGAAGSTLVIDRLASTHADARLVAHLAADEPTENARIVCAMYLADETRGRCRQVTAADLDRNPGVSRAPSGASPSPDALLLDADGLSYRIREVPPNGDFREQRWTRSHPGSDDGYDVLTLRDVVGRLEDYEPARTITFDALVLLGEPGRPSTCRLRGELERLTDSSIVLNRGLREAVQRKVARGEMTLSQIACAAGASSATVGATSPARQAGSPAVSARCPREGRTSPRLGFTARRSRSSPATASVAALTKSSSADPTAGARTSPLALKHGRAFAIG
jgi:hypothetical protein